MKTFLNSGRKHSTLHRCDSGPCLWYLGVLPSSLTRPFLFEKFLFHFLFSGGFSTVGSLLTHSFCCMLKLFFSNNPKGKAVRDSREKKEVGSVTCSCPDRPMAARLSEWNLSSSSMVAASMGTVFGAKEERSSRPQSRDTVWMGRVRDGRGSGSTFQSGYYTSATDE